MRPNRSGPDPISASPLEAAEFSCLLSPLAPSGPIAVAVSGGADSLAACLLTAAWARTEGRALTALTVDHGLRPDSAAEAAHVGAWLAAQGIVHVILNWTGPKPVTGIQAAARKARYDLLLGWCRQRGVRDLILAHHRDDQAETVLLRASQGSGPDGRAGMAAIVERGGVRLLRPLLAVPRDRLRATLIARKQPWVEDPSNHNPRFARVRARRALASVPPAAATLAHQAQVQGALRAQRDAEVGELVSAHISFAEAGYCWLAPGALTAPAAILARTLAWVMRTVAGRDYAPRQVSLDPLARWMRPGAQGARTLHGCVVAAHRGGFLVCREPRNLPVSPLISGTSAAWDGRFLVALEGGNPAVRYTVEPLGARGWQAIRKPTRHVVPYRAAQSAPALVAEGAVLAVPHLGVETPGVAFSVSPLSAKTLALTPFAVVSGPG